MSFAASPRADVGASGVFGQVMGLVAGTLGLLTLGAYLGSNLSGGASLICFVIAFGCVIGLNFVRNSGPPAIALLLATGLFLGLGLAGTLDAYAAVDPAAVWQAAAATALFVGGLGAVGYTTRTDLAAGYRLLSLLLFGLIAYGFITLFIAMPGAYVIYALLGLGIFGGYTILDFNRMRSAGDDDAVSIASGVFLDVLNVFLFFLQLFGIGKGGD